MESVSVALRLPAAIASSRRLLFTDLSQSVTDAAHGVTPSPVSDCGKIQKNLSVWVKQCGVVFGPSLAVRELLVTTSYVSSHQGAVCF